MKNDKKRNIDIEGNITYVNDTPVVNGESKTGEFYFKNFYSDKTIQIEVDGKVFEGTYKASDNYNGIGVKDLKEFYKNHNNSAKETYEYLTNYIKENKNNPEILKSTIDQLLGNFSDMYDETKNFNNVGSNQEDILDKILNIEDGEQLDNFICSTIHEFAMKTLQDCGVNAVMVSGKQYGSNDHSTLLYQVDENKYVLNNYDKNFTIEANNIKDAIREVYKNSGLLKSYGYIALKNGSKSSYREFALREESVFGKEMDKRDYNATTPFDSKIDNDTNIKGNVEISNQGNISAIAEGNIVKRNDNSNSEFGVSVGYKNNSETSLFKRSTSFGIKANYKKETQKSNDISIYHDTKIISTYTRGSADNAIYTGSSVDNSRDVIYSQIESQMRECGYGDDKLEEVKKEIGADSYIVNTVTQNLTNKSTYYSNFLKSNFGIKKDWKISENTNITNATQASLYGGVVVAKEKLGGTGNGSDARVCIEDGVKIDNQVDQFKFENTLNAGVEGDLKYTSGKQHRGIMLGTKLNAITSTTYNNGNWEIGGEASIYNIATPSVTERGGNIGFKGGYRTKSGVNIFGQTNFEIEKQKLNIGVFNETTENKLKFNTTVGAQISPNTTITVGYSQTKDKLNATRNNNTFNIGVRVKL